MTSQTSSLTGGNVLAVDTSTASGSLAIAKFAKDSPPQIICESKWTKLAMHSEVATLEVQSALKKANITLPEITHFAVNIGPGSFTGLRVGINLIRTLAYALEKPVATFSSLELLAFENGNEGEKIMVAIKAIQNFYYAAAYVKSSEHMQTLVEPFSGTLEEVHAKGNFDRTLVEGDHLKMSGAGARLLVQLCAKASFSPWNIVKPLYVRGSEAEEKLKKGILKPLP